jgi:hypothetical protein
MANEVMHLDGDQAVELARGVRCPPGMEWLRACLAYGLGALATVNLEGRPSHDTVRVTIGVFLQAALTFTTDWQQARDVGRLNQAFRLMSLRRSFPTPSDLLRAMEPAPPKPLSDEERAFLQEQQRLRAEETERQRQARRVQGPVQQQPIGNMGREKYRAALRAICARLVAGGAQPPKPREISPPLDLKRLKPVNDPLPPAEDHYGRAQWVRRQLGMEPFASQAEYEAHVLASRELMESVQAKE